MLAVIESKDVPVEVDDLASPPFPPVAATTVEAFPLPEMKKPSRFSSFAGIQSFKRVR